MENKTIQNLGKLYHLLDDACSNNVNRADLDNATRFPVRGVMMKITLAHKLHKMTPELDNSAWRARRGWRGSARTTGRTPAPTS